MSRAVAEDGGVNPTEEEIAMSDTLIKDNVSKNAAVEGTRDDAHSAMSKFHSEVYKNPWGKQDPQSDESNRLNAEFKKRAQSHISTEGDTKDMPNDAVATQPGIDAKASKSIDNNKDGAASSVDKCLPNLSIIDSGKQIDANPNASELSKNPPLDSQKNSAQKDSAQKDNVPKDLQMFHPQSADIPIVKGQ